MDPLKIEEADREFVRKLDELRLKLAGRQKAHQSKSLIPVWRRPAALLMTPLIIAGVGFAILYKKQNASPIIVRQQAAHADREQPPHPETSSSAGQSRPEENDSTAKQEPPVIQSTAPAVNAPPEQSSFLPKENIKKEVESEREHSSIADTAPQETEENNIELVSAVVCLGVRNHRHLAEKDMFELTNTRRAYIWMEVRSKEQPFVIKHVYYLNGRKYCEVPLDIVYPRMRTWSYVTLQKEDQAGAWTVEIVCNNRVLKTVGFQVSKG